MADGNATTESQQTSNYDVEGATAAPPPPVANNNQLMRSGGRATTVLTTKTTTQQSSNVWWQRQRMMMAGERQGAVVEAEEGRVMCVFLHGAFWGGGEHTTIIKKLIHKNNAPKYGEFFLFFGGYFGHYFKVCV